MLVEGLDDEVDRAELEGILENALLSDGTDDNDLGVGIQSHDLAQGVDAVVLGHDEVDGHDRGAEFGVTFNGFFPVAGLPHDFPARAAGRLLDFLPDNRGVIGHN